MMNAKRRRKLLLLFIIICFGALIACGFYGKNYTSLFSTRAVTVTPKTLSVLNEFVTRSGMELTLDGRPFRFAGANIHWLGLEDSTNYPSRFRVDDALDAAKEMGATVVRAHSLGISTGCGNCIEPSLGVFNATALQHVDYAIKAARDRGIRLIIPLTDNWHYATGGKHTFTDWRQVSDEDQFYFNSQVIQDFEVYIKTLLHRVNAYTGLAYKDDPTVMAWETGNELKPPISWTQTISAYIKSIDRNHLVIDGRSGGIDPHIASVADVDLVSNHYYPMTISRLEQDENTARQAGKAFFVGEFNWNDYRDGDKLGNFLSTIESHVTVVGDLFWELWPHDDQYGYVSGETLYTLHYPGDTPGTRAGVQLLRTHAYRLRNMAVPADSVPGSPVLSVVIRDNQVNTLVWRGTAIAASYSVERSTSSASGPWTTICDRCATDTSTPWTDRDAVAGMVWYRVIAYNLSGKAGSPSSPYQARSRNISVDPLNDWNKTYKHSDHLAFDTTHAQYMGGDSSVVVRTALTEEYIVWMYSGMTSFQAITYSWPDESSSRFSIYVSSDEVNWTMAQPDVTSLYTNWTEYIYTLSGLSNTNYVKIVWSNMTTHPWTPAVGEVTITS